MRLHPQGVGRRLLLCCLIAAPAVAGAQPLEHMAWLTGCWTADGGEPGSSEVWMPPAGGTMLGLGRTVRKGKTVEHEFIQIRPSADGKLVYLALPSGQTATSFSLKTLAEGEVIFENLQHDFPHRVIYRLQANGKLLARIEGMLKGQPRGIDFPMSRASCDVELKSQPPAQK